MIAEKLRKSILQAAIQGKLTEQLPEDGDARDLLAHIPEISEDEIPFDIPDNWCWVRMKDIGETNIGLTYRPSDVSIDGTLVLRSGNIQNDKMDYSDNVYVRCDIPENKRCHAGDILICARNGSKRLVGKAAIIDEEGMTFGAFMALFRSPFNKYIHKYLSSPYFRSDLDGVSTTTINQITQNNLKERLIPLPPLEEQIRIVNKIDSLLLKIDELAKDEKKLDLLQKSFPKKMKDSLLQAAIQGKLTERLESDGDARELMDEIQKDKERLVKEGKIKKEKASLEITEDEIPFDVPDNWCWVRLGDIFDIARGGSPRPIQSYLTSRDDGVNWIKIGDTEIGGKYINQTKEKILPEGMRKSRLVHSGDLLLTNSMSFGRPYILNTEGCIHDGWLVLSPVIDGINKEFFYYLISSEFVRMAFASTVAGAVVKNLNSDKVRVVSVPLPPLAEQQRIVGRLEQLLPLCDALE